MDDQNTPRLSEFTQTFHKPQEDLNRTINKSNASQNFGCYGDGSRHVTPFKNIDNEIHERDSFIQIEKEIYNQQQLSSAKKQNQQQEFE